MFPPAGEPSLPRSPYLKFHPASATPALPAVVEEGLEDEYYDAAHALRLEPHAGRVVPSLTLKAPALSVSSPETKKVPTDLRLHNKTAVLGGSFDPPHWGTAWCIRRLFAAGARDVWLMPADVHADKKGLSPFAIRYQMLVSLREHMCRHHQIDADRLVVTNAERFVHSGGQTLEVLREMKRWHPAHQFVLAVGADVGASLDAWPQAAALRSEFQPVVLERPGGPWRAELLAQDDEAILMSSTEIRALRRERRSIAACAPPEIVADIERANLYLETPLARAQKMLLDKRRWALFACLATLCASIALATKTRAESVDL